MHCVPGMVFTIEPMLNQGTRHVHLNYNDYCGNCLRKFSAEELIEVDRNKYFVVRNYICKSCYDHLVCDYVLNSRLLERKIMEKMA